LAREQLHAHGIHADALKKPCTPVSPGSGQAGLIKATVACSALSVRYKESLVEASIEPSVGSQETTAEARINGLYKTELITALISQDILLPATRQSNLPGTA